MTGKTHMAISAATVAVALSAMGSRASNVRVIDSATYPSGAYAIVGLLLLGVVAGLFPDLDAPDTELQHLPQKEVDRMGRYLTVRMSRRSLLPAVTQGLLWLALLPFEKALAAIGAGLRAYTVHRGFTHTLLGALAFTALAVGAAFLITGDPRCSLAVGVVWALGYASHLAADACTPSGIPLLRTPIPIPVSVQNAPLRRVTVARAVRSLGEPGKGVSRVGREARHARSSTYTRGHTRSGVGPLRGATFHLLPRRLRIRTGTSADTLVVRWASWTVCLIAAVPMFIF